MKIPDFFLKNKKITVLICIGILSMALLVFSEVFTKSDSSDEAEEDQDDYSYAENIEADLTEIITEIEGAGNTKVMVTLESGVESVYAVNKKTQDDLPESEYVIIDTGSKKGGLLLKITAPKIRGVAVVCEGGDKSNVKEKITDTITAVLDISSNRVNISKMR